MTGLQPGETWGSPPPWDCPAPQGGESTKLLPSLSNWKTAIRLWHLKQCIFFFFFSLCCSSFSSPSSFFLLLLFLLLLSLSENLRESLDNPLRTNSQKANRGRGGVREKPMTQFSSMEPYCLGIWGLKRVMHCHLESGASRRFFLLQCGACGPAPPDRDVIKAGDTTHCSDLWCPGSQTKGCRLG